MSEKHETVADIVAEIRRDKNPYALKIATELDNASGDTVLNAAAATCLRDDCAYIKKLAARIEAAWEREREQHADDLEAAGFVAAMGAAKRERTGNAARMREALEKCHAVIDALAYQLFYQLPLSSIMDDAFGAQKAISAALSAPARNCDRFATHDELWDTFLRERPNDRHFDEDFINWLFAPAAESEGGSK